MGGAKLNRCGGLFQVDDKLRAALTNRILLEERVTLFIFVRLGGYR
jgi:hypothetical protein